MRTKKANSFNKKVFGKRLKAFRDEIGIIQEEFAKGINRTRSAYVVIESGRVAPSVDVMVDIYNLIHKNGIKVSMDYLFGLSDFKSDAEAAKDITKKYQDLKKDYEKMVEINSLQKQLLGKK